MSGLDHWFGEEEHSRSGSATGTTAGTTAGARTQTRASEQPGHPSGTSEHSASPEYPHAAEHPGATGGGRRRSSTGDSNSRRSSTRDSSTRESGSRRSSTRESNSRRHSTPRGSARGSSARHSPPRHGTHRSNAQRSLGGRIAGLLGELLITLGVLLALYVVWQVWWTDVVAHQAAADNIGQWEMTLPEAPQEVAEPRTDEPPPETPVAEGEQFATMYVPAWGADWRFPVAAGVDYATVLDNGFVGHYTETALPGQLGNFGLAGHRQMYGRPFYAVDELTPGDEIIVRTANAWYVYHVTDYEIIQPHEVDVLAPVPREPETQPTERMITLTTCHPLWSIAERYVVYGELDHWVDPADGHPAAMENVGSGVA